METVKKFTKLMLTRRGYTDIVETENRSKLVAKKPNLKKVIVFFLNKEVYGDKITTQIFKQLIVASKEIFHIILVHEIPLTADAKQNVTLISEDQNSELYRFETFTFDDLKYDLFEALFEDANDPQNVVFCKKIIDKIPIILYTDPLAKYVGARSGDFLLGYFDGSKNLEYRRCLNI